MVFWFYFGSGCECFKTFRASVIATLVRICGVPLLLLVFISGFCMSTFSGLSSDDTSCSISDGVRVWNVLNLLIFICMILIFGVLFLCYGMKGTNL